MVASELFSEGDRAAVSAAVTEAEKGTSAEIVPVVATASDDYDRAEDTFGLWCALALVLVLLPLLLQKFPFASGKPADGDLEWEAFKLTLVVLGLVVGGWTVGIVLATNIPFLKRLTAGGAMRRCVEQAAEQAFDRLHVRKTKGATGVVVYVSLVERMVCVEADQAVAEKVAPEEWKSICDGMIGRIREGKPRDAFVEAIRKCGDLLARHFPVQPGDVNELTNELRILD